MAGLLLSILLVTAGELAPPPGMCTCTAQDKALDAAIAEQVKAADFIFEGVVLEVHDYPSAEARRLMADSSRVRFGFGRRRYAFFVAPLRTAEVPVAGGGSAGPRGDAEEAPGD